MWNRRVSTLKLYSFKWIQVSKKKLLAFIANHKELVTGFGVVLSSFGCATFLILGTYHLHLVRPFDPASDNDIKTASNNACVKRVLIDKAAHSVITNNDVSNAKDTCNVEALRQQQIKELE
jgi:hypothetical protein